MEALNELKTEDFEQAMQIILHRHPGLLQANTEVLNIDFGPLDALTLRQLAAFCHFCLKGTNPEFANSWPGLLFGAGKLHLLEQFQPVSKFFVLYKCHCQWLLACKKGSREERKL